MMLGVSIPNQAASGPPHASTARARRPAQVLRPREVGTRSKWGSNTRTTGTTKTVMNRPAARGSQAPSGRSARRLDRSSGRARKRAGKQPRPGARAGASGRDAGWAWSLHRNQWWPPRGAGGRSRESETHDLALLSGRGLGSIAPSTVAYKGPAQHADTGPMPLPRSPASASDPNRVLHRELVLRRSRSRRLSPSTRCRRGSSGCRQVRLAGPRRARRPALRPSTPDPPPES
jgi:hypothetical protein